MLSCLKIHFEFNSIKTDIKEGVQSTPPSTLLAIMWHCDTLGLVWLRLRYKLVQPVEVILHIDAFQNINHWAHPSLEHVLKSKKLFRPILSGFCSGIIFEIRWVKLENLTQANFWDNWIIWNRNEIETTGYGFRHVLMV